MRTSRIYCKDDTDTLLWKEEKINCSVAGAPRRCGGLGDVLSGVIAAVISMHCDINTINDVNINDCIMFAGELIRKASRLAFEQRSRGMSATDVIANIPKSFDEMTE